MERARDAAPGKVPPFSWEGCEEGIEVIAHTIVEEDLEFWLFRPAQAFLQVLLFYCFHYVLHRNEGIWPNRASQIGKAKRF